MDEELYDLPVDCDFSTVWNNSGQSFDCSPRLKDPFFSSFRGILINGPEEVVWPEDAEALLESSEATPDGNAMGPVKLMVAGLLKIPHNTLGLNGDRAYEVLTVAVSRSSGESYSGKMQRMGTAAEIVEGAPPIEEDTTEYFNIDLISNLELPIAADTYQVYATLGPYKSNTIVIKTRCE
ncbi:hypothetical protein ACXYTJ_00395 [Gilvimarinus sp. F26214L]|uniref:hypothetical protein n=1 Tax=Gilvimarinus sp. DZF01 TaxID=3461371 RepID=UPI0040463CB2